MSTLKGYAAKLGFTAISAGSILSLAFSAGSDIDLPNRTGWYTDLATTGSEKYAVVVGGTEAVNAQGSTLSTGRLAVLYTTAATDSTTGALVVAGGVGIADALHIGSATIAGAGQYAGSLSTQGGIRAGFGLPAGTLTRPAMILSQGATVGTVVGVNTYTALVSRANVSDSNNTNHHTSLLGRIGGSSGGSGAGRARLSGVMGLAYFDAFNESHTHLTGGYFLADSQGTRPQDFHITGSWVGIRTGNFRSNVANSRAVGLDSFVDVQNSQGGNGQQAYGVRSISSYTITSDSAVSAANYGGYFEAVCNVTGAGSSVTNAYGIYATASGAVNNYAGYFDGDTTITGLARVTDITASTDTTTGALVVGRGVGIAGGVHAGDTVSLHFPFLGVMPNFPQAFSAIYDGGDTSNPIKAFVANVTHDSGSANIVGFDSTVLSYSTATVHAFKGIAECDGGVVYGAHFNAKSANVVVPLYGVYAEVNDGAATAEIRQHYAAFLNGDTRVDGYLYLGAKNTDGSWRYGKSTNDVIFQRREAGVWVTKMTVAAA